MHGSIVYGPYIDKEVLQMCYWSHVDEMSDHFIILNMR